MGESWTPAGAVLFKGLHCSAYWCGTTESWDSAGALLARYSEGRDPAGLDSEFEGWNWTTNQPDFEWDIRKSTCYLHTRIHVWSVGLLTDTLHPRGYRRAVALVFPGAAMYHPSIRAWLEGPSPKDIHNLPVDDHSFYNHGIRLGGTRNTLNLSRWIWPERVEIRTKNKKAMPFGLKELGEDKLGVKVEGEFAQLFSEVVKVEKPTKKKVKRCICGARPCRKRTSDPAHQREVVVEHGTKLVDKKRIVPLHLITEEHPLFKILIPYAGWDAARGVELGALARKKWVGGKERYLPW